MGLYLVNLVLLLSVNLSNKVMTVKHFMHLKLLKLCLALSAYLSAHRPPFHWFSSLKKALELAVHQKRDSHEVQTELTQLISVLLQGHFCC